MHHIAEGSHTCLRTQESMTKSVTIAVCVAVLQEGVSDEGEGRHLGRVRPGQQWRRRARLRQAPQNVCEYIQALRNVSVFASSVAARCGKTTEREWTAL